MPSAVCTVKSGAWLPTVSDCWLPWLAPDERLLDCVVADLDVDFGADFPVVVFEAVDDLLAVDLVVDWRLAGLDAVAVFDFPVVVLPRAALVLVALYLAVLLLLAVLPLCVLPDFDCAVRLPAVVFLVEADGLLADFDLLAVDAFLAVADLEVVGVFACCLAVEDLVLVAFFAVVCFVADLAGRPAVVLPVAFLG